MKITYTIVAWQLVDRCRVIHGAIRGAIHGAIRDVIRDVILDAIRDVILDEKMVFDVLIHF